MFLDASNVGLLYLPDTGEITRASANSSPDAINASLLSLNLDLAMATHVSYLSLPAILSKTPGSLASVDLDIVLVPPAI